MAAASPIRELNKRELVIEVLRSSGQVRLAARGFSMLPSLWPGDILTVHSATIDQLVPGDVVFFRCDEALSIHRVQGRTVVNGAHCLVTRGDSMTQKDRPVDANQVLGKVVAVERGGHQLGRIPECTVLSRCVGLLLGSWDRLRSVVLRWRQRTSSAPVETDVVAI